VYFLTIDGFVKQHT